MPLTNQTAFFYLVAKKYAELIFDLYAEVDDHICENCFEKIWCDTSRIFSSLSEFVQIASPEAYATTGDLLLSMDKLLELLELEANNPDMMSN